VWTEYINYDGGVYFNLKSEENYPIKLTQNLERIKERLLPSDSSKRLDIKLREELNI
jgi:hypothetical protein